MRRAGTGRAAGVILAALLVACTPATPAPAPAAVARTVFLVRHAEKAAQPADDPPLTPAGEARAKALAAALSDAGVTSILTTQLLRTRATARPLAAQLGIAPQAVAVSRAARDHAREVARTVREQPPGAVLVVGHSNTVPLIIEALGGPKLPDICDAAYANLYVVTIAADGAVTLARVEYGARSGDDANCPGTSPR